VLVCFAHRAYRAAPRVRATTRDLLDGVPGVGVTPCVSARPSHSMNFVDELERLVVAQICNCFDTVNLAAADALCEVLSRFLLEVGHSSHGFADLAGRTDINACDVICALHGLGSTFERVIQNAEGFEAGAYTRPLLSST